MSEEVSRIFVDGLYKLGLLDQRNEKDADHSITSGLLCYRQELLSWNARFNLTAITDPEEVLLKHFLDSLSLLQVYDEANTKLLDIGSGAGFPGLVLKIARPAWRITLIEATGKKTQFLKHMIDVLDLKEIEVIHGRAEEIAHEKQYRGKFDLVTARAVSALPTLLEYCAPYSRMHGSIILFKKGDLTEELAQGRRAGMQVGAVLKAEVSVDLPGLKDGRRLLVWEQTKLCPPQFPRSGSVMARKPLN